MSPSDRYCYHLHRAEAEAVRAIGADSDLVGALHQELCLLHSGQAIAGLIEQSVQHIRARIARYRQERIAEVRSPPADAAEATGGGAVG